MPAVTETEPDPVNDTGMKRLLSIDLRLWLPVLVTALLAGLLLIVDAVHQRQMLAEHLAEHRASLTRNLQRLATLAAGPGDAEPAVPVEALLALYTDQPGLEALQITTATGKVLHPAGAAAAREFDPALARAARTSGRLVLRALPGDRLVAYQPLAGGKGDPGPLLFMIASHDHPRSMLADLGGYSVLLLLAPVLLVLVLLQQVFIRRPLRLLAQRARRLARNDFAPLPVTGRGEIAELAEAFNLMGHQLQQALGFLQQREQQLSRTLEAIGEAVITTDEQGRITRLNPAAEALTGWSAENAHGLPLETVFVLEDAKGRLIGQLVDRLHASGQALDLGDDAMLRRRDGEHRRIAASAAPVLHDDGVLEGLILVFRDVTEDARLREENRIAAIAFDTHNAIAITDGDGRILRVNSAFALLTGYAADAITGHALAELDRVEAPNMPPIQRCLTQARESAWSGRRALQRHDGESLPVWATINAVRDEQGNITHFVASFSDLSELDHTAHALLESQSRYQSLIDALNDGVLMIRHGELIDCNDKLLDILQRPREAVVGHPLVDLSPPVQADGRDSAEKAREIFARVLAGQPQIFDWVQILPNGDCIDVEVSLTRILLDEQPTLIGVMRNVTERRAAERQYQQLLLELERKEAQIRLATHAAGVGLWEWNIANDHVSWSEGAEAIYGLGPGELGHTLDTSMTLVHPEDTARLDEAIRRSLEENAPLLVEYRVIRTDGAIRWVELSGMVERDANGRATYLRGAVQDITERHQARQEIERLAYYDPLTGLANRRLMLDRLQQAIAHAQREGTHGGLIFIDLDRFKLLNDSLGHRAGDMLLQQVTRRLTESLREEDTVARLGGDEFVIMLPALDADPAQAARHAWQVAEKIRTRISGGYDLDGHSFHITASLGIALFPEDGVRADVLLNHADAAMYQAKGNGRDTIAYYHSSLQTEADARLALEEDLREALRAEQLFLEYQAQVDNRQEPVCVEALLRWQHQTRGQVAPGEFIPLAEETGLILSIGEWVLLSACQQLRAWMDDPAVCTPGLSVNVSPVQFRHSGFIDQVAMILRRTGVDPRLLTLEITEGTLIEDLDDTITKLRALKELGLRISVDDFGTGYSSLYYLKHLPLDELKIDRAYVQDITEDANDAAIVETILSMSRHLGLEVVAEGVETPAQAGFLRDHGCHRYQGFLYCRPMRPADLTRRFLGRKTETTDA